MTVKEKAKELITNYHNELVDNEFRKSYYAAKKCATIAASECLSVISNEYSDTTEAVQYWKDVLTEIDKL